MTEELVAVSVPVPAALFKPAPGACGIVMGAAVRKSLAMCLLFTNHFSENQSTNNNSNNIDLSIAPAYAALLYNVQREQIQTKTEQRRPAAPERDLCSRLLSAARLLFACWMATCALH